MEKIELGRTGLFVSRLCFGTLTLSPLQRGMSVKQGANLMRAAFDHGVNFIDTAELYDNYAHIAKAIKGRSDIIVSTKCYAFDEATASKSFDAVRKALGREHIDIFMLHEQESEHTLRGHAQALEFFYKKREAGEIGALGISTHFVAGVWAALKHPLVQIIHPIFNLRGIGIVDGIRPEMELAAAACSEAGMGVLAMKPLGGGHLISCRDEALRYVLDAPYVHSVAIGMQSQAEIAYNCALVSGQSTQGLAAAIGLQERQLLIHDWCEGCGRCVKTCQQKALRMQDGQAVVDTHKCVLCGYCAPVCPQFCIKII